jgi:CheY-like chemotaxis protein
VSVLRTTTVGTGSEALEALQSGRFDCMVLDLRLPDMAGQALIERIQEELGLRDLPIIVYTGKDLSRKEETQLKKLTEAIIIKDVRSPERLLAETSLFLHRASERLATAQRRILEQLHQKDPMLAGKKVLIIDDDIRNIFALTSILELQEMEVVYAENGRDGLTKLNETPDVDVVLVDIMMPEMDGYEVMRMIRKMPDYASLPLIAVTAKAMKVDRSKCIEAGASDYIAKPVDSDQLFSLLRVWLYR